MLYLMRFICTRLIDLERLHILHLCTRQRDRRITGRLPRDSNL